MSRSRKHSGWVCDACCKKFPKRVASKRARRCSDLPNGNHYRKLYESYNICDWKVPAREMDSDADAYRDWMK